MVQCALLIAPNRSPSRGEGIVAADDYASLIDPTGEAMPKRLATPHPDPLPQGERGSLLRLEARPGLLTHRGWNPRTLPQARDAGLASAEAWEFGQIPSLPPLAVATTMRR